MTIIVGIALFLRGAQAADGGAPELPRVWVDTKWVEPGGKTTYVSKDLQAALDAAQPGDTLVLNRGATWTGNFVLPAKANPDNKWIVLRSGTLYDIPPEGERLDPAINGANLPKILSASVEPALRCAPNANHYRIIGLEFGITPAVTMSYDIVRIGEGTETDAARTPHDIIIDRCYIHGNPLAHAKRGVQLNSRATAVIGSYIGEIHGLGQDTQAIAGFNGPGPFKIDNNFLEGAAENVMFGGATPAIAGLVPSDIEIRGNHFFKPPFWRDGVLPTPHSMRGRVAQVVADGALAGGTYYYRVAAVGRAGYNNETEVTSPATPEIAVSVGDHKSADLQWSGPSWAQGYRVYRTSDAPGVAQRRWVFYSCAPPPTTVEAAVPQRGWNFYFSSRVHFTDTGAAGATLGTPPENGPTWSVKNLFELKNARRVLVDGNILECNWPNAQAGPSILFTVRTEDGAAPQAVVEDVTFSNNIVCHVAAVFNILGQDGNRAAHGQTQRILIRNNLFTDIGGSWGGNGTLLLMTGAARHIAFEHNTSFQRGTLAQISGPPHTGFVFRNNIVRNGEYGFKGDGTGTGNSAIAAFFVEPEKNVIFTVNAILGGEARWYPPGNLFPADEVAGFVDATQGDFRLRPDSPLKGKAIDFASQVVNHDLGADLAALQASTWGALRGNMMPGAKDAKG